MLQHSAKQQREKKNQPISMLWLMNIYDWPIMAYGQKINHFNAALKTDFDESPLEKLISFRRILEE